MVSKRVTADAIFDTTEDDECPARTTITPRNQATARRGKCVWPARTRHGPLRTLDHFQACDQYARAHPNIKAKEMASENFGIKGLIGCLFLYRCLNVLKSYHRPHRYPSTDRPHNAITA